MQKENRSFLGVSPKVTHTPYSLVQSFWKANSSFVTIITDMGQGLWKMIRGEISVKEISGPIGILQVVGEASKQGFLSILWLSVFVYQCGLVKSSAFPGFGWRENFICSFRNVTYSLS